jgi:hypothetical protein
MSNIAKSDERHTRIEENRSLEGDPGKCERALRGDIEGGLRSIKRTGQLCVAPGHDRGGRFAAAAAVFRMTRLAALELSPSAIELF